MNPIITKNRIDVINLCVIDHNSKILTSSEDGLDINCIDCDGWTFILGNSCKVIAKGNYCTFITGDNCELTSFHWSTFKTGDSCVFSAHDNCYFITGDRCRFNIGNRATIKSGDNCVLHFRDYCVVNIGDECVVDANIFGGSTINAGKKCKLFTNNKCIFNTGPGCQFITGDNCVFSGGGGCTYKCGRNCYVMGITAQPVLEGILTSSDFFDMSLKVNTKEYCAKHLNNELGMEVMLTNEEFFDYLKLGRYHK